MRQRQLNLITVVLLVLSLTELQAQSMYVKAKDGTQTSYSLSGIRKLTFPTDSVEVTNTNGISQSYFLSNVSYLSFADYTTDISLVKRQSVNFIQLYPNPSSDVLNIIFQATETGTMHLHIINLQGQIVVEQMHENKKGENSMKLNISNLPAGLYLVNNGVEIRKFVKFIK